MQSSLKNAEKSEERSEESRRCLASLVEPAAFGVSVRQRGGAAGSQEGGKAGRREGGKGRVGSGGGYINLT